MDIDSKVVIPSDTFSSRIPLAVDVLNIKVLIKLSELLKMYPEISFGKAKQMIDMEIWEEKKHA